MDKNVITIGTGKKLYLDLAINLAISFLWWHPNDQITFHLITDMADEVPENIKDKIKIIPVNKREFGEGFSPKLHLDKLAPHGQTLFIDSDCLIYDQLGSVFEKFKGHAVSVIGGYIADGEWFGDIKQICTNYNIIHIPKFNGGIYYLEKGATTDEVYETARQLEQQYDDIGFVRLRNRPNDEVIMALAMQLHQQTPIIEDGTIMSDPQMCPGGYDTNVLTGKRWLINPPKPHLLHQDWYLFEKVSPLIVHYLAYHTEHYIYKKEAYRLKNLINNTANALTEPYAWITIELPMRCANWFRITFRPFYRAIFGIRRIKTSKRI